MKLMKKIEKQIDYENNIKNHLWNALILSIIGTIGLVLNPNTNTKKILIGVGVLFIAIFFNAYFKKDDKIQNLINKLED